MAPRKKSAAAADTPPTTVKVEPGDVVGLDVGHRGAEIRDGAVTMANRDRRTFSDMFSKLDQNYQTLRALRSKNDGYIATKMREYHQTLKPPRSGQNRYDVGVIYRPRGFTNDGHNLEEYGPEEIWHWFNDYIINQVLNFKAAVKEINDDQKPQIGTIEALQAIKNMATTIPQRFNEISLVRLTVRALRAEETDPAIRADYDTMLDVIGDTRARVAALWEMSTHYIARNGVPPKPVGHSRPLTPPIPLSDPEIGKMMRSQFDFVDDLLARLTRLMDSEPIKPLLDEKRKELRAEQGLDAAPAVAAVEDKDIRRARMRLQIIEEKLTEPLAADERAIYERQRDELKATLPAAVEAPKAAGYAPKPLTGWDGLRDFVNQRYLQKREDFSRVGETPQNLATLARKISDSLHGVMRDGETVGSPKDAAKGADSGVGYRYEDLKRFSTQSHRLYDMLESFEEKPGIDSQTIEACKTARKELRMLNRTMDAIDKFCDMTLARAQTTDLPPH